MSQAFHDFCFVPGQRSPQIRSEEEDFEDEDEEDVQELAVDIVTNDSPEQCDSDSDADRLQELAVDIVTNDSRQKCDSDSDADRLQARAPVVEGPLWCKLLVPSYFAGGMIGKGGKNMAEFEKLTGCNVRMSVVNVCFPGTLDRMLAVGATSRSGLESCLDLLLAQMRAINQRQKGQRFVVKMLIPSSSASKLIGRDGCHARELKQTTGCRASVSRRNPGIQERVVLLAGEEECLSKGAKLVAWKIQDDPHLVEHMHFSYDVELALGCWDCCRPGPLEPNSELLPPQVARNLPKRILVEHLLKAAPREILVRHRLLGGMRKILKMKTHEQIMHAIEETWSSSEKPYTERDLQGMLPFHPVGLLPSEPGDAGVKEVQSEKDWSAPSLQSESQQVGDAHRKQEVSKETQGIIRCAQSLLDKAHGAAKQMDGQEAKAAIGVMAATMLKELLQVVQNSEAQDCLEQLEALNIRYLDGTKFLDRNAILE